MARLINPIVEELNKLPDTLLISDFTLIVEQYTQIGVWNQEQAQAEGVSGTAWLSFDCGASATLSPHMKMAEGYHHLLQRLEVVPLVTHPQTEISIADAIKMQPGIRVGETFVLEMAVTKEEFRDLARYDGGVVSWLKERRAPGQILVEFEGVTIQMVNSNSRVGRITRGKVVYPTAKPIPSTIHLNVAGFTLLIRSLVLTPRGGHGEIKVQLPSGIASTADCHSAELDLGDVAISPICEVYVEKPEDAFGPWIIGDSGLVVQGTGYILDLSLSHSPMPRLASWRGLELTGGAASGAGLLPDCANTAYLNGQYAFAHAVITQDGFQGHLELSANHTFHSLHPLDYVIELQSGWLDLVKSAVTSGSLGAGYIQFPATGVCDGSVGNSVRARFSSLIVLPSLDLEGEIFLDGASIAWGELTHLGSEQIFWQAEAQTGYLFLPANPIPSFSPDQGSSFLDLQLTSDALVKLHANGIAGATLNDLDNLQIFSPDRPGGSTNPILFEHIYGWLNLASHGVHGELLATWIGRRDELGNPSRRGYIGVKPFDVLLMQDKLQSIAQYASSAMYDSHMNGEVKIPDPCKIDQLIFREMKLTSTAHLVGGNVELPVGGVKLNYWDLSLVPTGITTEAGVLSVRTGRIVFTAAGITEPRHFTEVFKLTWMEMLANGDLGELFLDFNNNGQRFDKLPFTPHHLALSRYDPAITNPHLAVCGTVHLNFFGLIYVNVRDARHNIAADPYNNRKVSVPDFDEAACDETDLYLHGIWRDNTGDDLAEFDFPDVKMAYDEALQDGFKGNGSSEIKFLHSDGLDAQIEIHGGVIDIHLTSSDQHDIDLGLNYRVGGLNGIMGCVRIDGPLLQRMSLYGYLESSAATGMGILAPKAGCVVEVNLTTTPNSLDFNANGDLMISVAGSAVDLSGSVHLLYDYSRGSAEGDVLGRFDCNSVIAGLEGEGQVTWYFGPDMYFLQGRMKVVICSWTGSGGFEGGLFLGIETPKEKAWVIYAGSEKFHMTGNILPDKLTGVFGYGQLSFSVNFVIFGGGIEIYAALGAFSSLPAASPGDGWSIIAGALMPCILGRCGISVHGEILGGLVSISAWGILSLLGPPFYFEGSLGLEGCVLWVLCASVEVTAGFDDDGFYMA